MMLQQSHNKPLCGTDAHLRLCGTARLATYFHPLLQAGFTVEAQVGIPMQQLLQEVFRVDLDYLENRLQTMFLNGRPVDAPKETVVENDAVIALSAALPGLVGATMRRSGRYAALRDSISAVTTRHSSAACPGRITVKLFNVTAKELGPHFLQRGILLKGPDLHQFLHGIAPSFWKECTAAFFNENDFLMQRDKLLQKLKNTAIVALVVAQ